MTAPQYRGNKSSFRRSGIVVRGIFVVDGERAVVVISIALNANEDHAVCPKGIIIYIANILCQCASVIARNYDV